MSVRVFGVAGKTEREQLLFAAWIACADCRRDDKPPDGFGSSAGWPEPKGAQPWELRPRLTIGRMTDGLARVYWEPLFCAHVMKIQAMDFPGFTPAAIRQTACLWDWTISAHVPSAPLTTREMIRLVSVIFMASTSIMSPDTKSNTEFFRDRTADQVKW
jgi:hypothetical protein